jgi:hypothetical protein
MSWQACDAVDRIPHAEVKELAFRVLLKLANVAAQDGSRAWRNMHEVAVELGVSYRSVQRAVKDLEYSRLILRGDQSHVAYIRADRRPTVYDLNLPKMVDWEGYHSDPEVELDGVTHGVTPLSTDPPKTAHGVTHGVTTVVAHRELRELDNSSTQSNHRSDRCKHVFAETGWCINYPCTERQADAS